MWMESVKKHASWFVGWYEKKKEISSVSPSPLCGVSKVRPPEAGELPDADNTSSSLPQSQQRQQHEPSRLDGSAQRPGHQYRLCAGVCVCLCVRRSEFKLSTQETPMGRFCNLFVFQRDFYWMFYSF